MSQKSTHKQCFLCGQIEGDAPRDLLAKMLPLLPYQRRVIVENDTFAVIPSLGALTDGHVLLCPKTHMRSFAQALNQNQAGLETKFSQVKETIRSLLEQRFDADVHIFEHGMAAIGDCVPCTIDHAHLHFIPVKRSIDVNYHGDDSWDGDQDWLTKLAQHTHNLEYIMYQAPDGTTHVSKGPPGSFPSQSMRRLFAASLGCDEQWNWRTSPQPELADAIWQSLSCINDSNFGNSTDTVG